MREMVVRTTRDVAQVYIIIYIIINIIKKRDRCKYLRDGGADDQGRGPGLYNYIYNNKSHGKRDSCKYLGGGGADDQGRGPGLYSFYDF
jgi:hypothetical protein